MSLRILTLALALALGVGLPAAPLRAAEPSPSGAAAEAGNQALISAIRANRKALVAANLRLTDAEAAAFWPVYARYQQAIDAVGDRGLAVIRNYIERYEELADAEAQKLLEDFLAVEAERVTVRRDFVPEFSAILPGRKLARLYQIENKMDALLRYDLAATIPVLESEPAGTGAK